MTTYSIFHAHQLAVCRFTGLLSVLWISGCTHISEKSGEAFKKRDVESAISRAARFYHEPIAGRINPDDIWLYKQAARLAPALRTSSLQAIDPFQRYPGHAILRLFDANWRPDDLSIQPASKKLPAQISGGAYHFSDPHHRELYLPRDEVLLKAMYCRDFGYEPRDLDILLATIDNDGGYNDTHALASLLIIRQSGCLPPETLAPHIATLVEILIRTQNSTELFNDLYVERVAFLYWAGAGDQVERKWIKTILDRQLDNGGWNADGSPKANLHQTALAALSLIYYLDGKKEQPFYGLFPR